MHREIVLAWLILAAVAVFVPVDAAPYSQQAYMDPFEDDDQALYDLIAQYRKIKDVENSKRGFGLDFGVNRGYSGAQAAKQMMGLAAANYANGPGRRRRSEQA